MIEQNIKQTITVDQADQKVFNSKILLFGEYGIIKNAMGLSIPFNDYFGSLAFSAKSGEHQKSSNETLSSFAQYLRELKQNDELLCDLDHVKLESDIYDGLYFDSTIPQGFGVGSSGALCAAIYNDYSINRIEKGELTNDQLILLKEIFAQMESFFHGKSSGLDPLSCYLSVPVLVKSKTDLSLIDLPSKNKSGSIFLIDTGIPGNTEPLVKWFGEQYANQGFASMFKDEFIPFNDQCIKQFLKGETKALFQSLYQLSKFLHDNLSPMIPDAFKEIWSYGLETGAYTLKLCGSGGGGYILGFTPDYKKVQKVLADYNIKEIYQF